LPRQALRLRALVGLDTAAKDKTRSFRPPASIKWTAMDFPPRWGENCTRLEAPFLFNGPAWSRNKTRVRTSQFVTMPLREPRKAFRSGARPSLRRRRRSSRRHVGRDGNKG